MNWKLLLVTIMIVTFLRETDAWWGRRRRRRRPPPPRPKLSPHCQHLVNQYGKLHGNNLHTLARVWAPAVKLARGEPWNPSSVDFFLPHMRLEGMPFHGRLTSRNLPSCNRGCFLVSKGHLKCASCTNLKFLHGQHPNSAPVYVFINRHGNVVEFDYRFFFPYNRGKRACVGIMWHNHCPCFKTPWGCACPRVTKCLGKYSTFGHHVGDWESIKVRFINGRIHSMFLSTHTSAITNKYLGTFQWNGLKFQKGGTNRNIEMEGCTHGVAYAAAGSHGFWNVPGNHVYKNLPNGERLVDSCSRGLAWNTWNNLKITNKQSQRWRYGGEFAFARYLGRWGNHERHCGAAKKLFGVCILEDGPHLSL